MQAVKSLLTSTFSSRASRASRTAAATTNTTDAYAYSIVPLEDLGESSTTGRRRRTGHSSSQPLMQDADTHTLGDDDNGESRESVVEEEKAESFVDKSLEDIEKASVQLSGCVAVYIQHSIISHNLLSQRTTLRTSKLASSMTQIWRDQGAR